MVDMGHSATRTVKQLGGGDYLTIGDAIDNAFQGDVIEVYAGRYEEAVVVDKELTLKGMGPQVVTIVVPQQADAITVNTSSPVSISGFKISSGTHGIVFLVSDFTCEIKNCVIEGCGGSGIYLRNIVPFNISILNNTIVSNVSDGVHLEVTVMSPSCTAVVAGNIIAFNGGYGLYNSARYGTTENFISYNDLFSNSAGNYYPVLPNFGDISENPQFVDKDAGNYVLANSSSCINSGREGSAYNDPDGSRNDMGAYGGPDCASYWPYPVGAPIVTQISATPTSVPQGSTITIEATGEVYE
jgi:hypothetical protein